MNKKVFLAVDLGAGSGRVMAALFDGEKLSLEEVSRWASAPVKLGNSYHWDANDILKNIVEGLRKARRSYGEAIVSMGIDTWGVDYALLDAGGKLLNLPYIYRDSRTDGMMDEVFAKVPKKQIYASTGIQFMFFNTIFQIMAEIKKGGNIDKAASFLMMPDLLSYMLTGERVNERTNASTTQFYNPFKRDWDFDILCAIGAPEKIFKSGFAECGDVIGRLRGEYSSELGDVPVVAVASHDTASAVAATPSGAEVPAYINSGTWCLPGVELKSPVATEESFGENFTNEVGAEDTIRFLKNVTGMWLVQKSKEAWKARGEDKDYRELEAAATASEAMRTHFDPDAPDFVMPEDMTRAIAEHCMKRGIAVPDSHGRIFRAIQESIALKYAYVFETIERLTAKNVSQINVMGGGSKDSMLNQFTANSTGKLVKAGPTESTALGNAIIQMKSAGCVSSLKEGREVVAKSFDIKSFEPQKSESGIWADAYGKFKREVLNK